MGPRRVRGALASVCDQTLGLIDTIAKASPSGAPRSPKAGDGLAASDGHLSTDRTLEIFLRLHRRRLAGSKASGLFDTGIAHMDRVSLREGRAELAQIVSRQAQVEQVLCGHVHRSIQRRFAGTIVQTAPSVAHQVAFDLRDDGPSAFVLEPPAFLVHSFDGSGIVTHEVEVDRAPGPLPFVLPPEYPGLAAASGEKRR